MADDLSLDIGDVSPAAPQPDALSLDKLPPKIDPAIAERRAVEAHAGLGEKSPGLPVLQNAIASGTEDSLRRATAAQEDLASRQQRMGVIRDLATRAKGGITPELAQDIMTVGTTKDSVDPNVVWEKNFARTFINRVGVTPSWSTAESLATDPDGSHDAMNAAEDMITRKKIAQHRKENMEAEFKEEGLLDKVGDYAKTFLPLYSGYKLNQVLKEEAPTLGIFPGNTIGEKVAYLHTLPPGQFREKLDQALTILKASSPLDAIRFAEAVDHYSASDAAFDNAMGALDLLTLPGVGMARKAVLKGAEAVAGGVARGAAETGAKALGEAASRGVVADTVNTAKVGFRNLLKGAVKEATEGESVDIGKAFARVGDIPKAAEINAAKEVANGFADVNPLKERGMLFRKLPTMFNPEAIGDAGASMAREASERLISSLKSRADGLFQALAKPSAVVRLTPEAEQVGIEETKNALYRQYGFMNDTVLDVAHQVERQENTLKNVNTVHVFLGTKDGELFTTPRDAYKFGEFYGLPTDAYKIEQVGAGYAIKVSKVVDETTPAVRQAMTISTKNQTPQSMINTFITRLFRTPDDLISKTQRDARNTALHSTQEVHKWVKEAAEDIGSLSKKEATSLRTVLEHNRDYIDPQTQLRGQFYNTVSDLEKGYMDAVGRLPSEREVKAYYAYVQLNDFDWVSRNLTIFRDKARQGIEDITFKIAERDAQTGKVGYRDLDRFNGKRVDDIPWSNADPANIWIHDNKPDGLGRLVSTTTPGSKDEIDKLRAEGWSIIQVANPLEKPLSEVAQTQKSINFVVSKDWHSKPLDWQQLPYRPGGHVQYQGEHFVKQPMITRAMDETGQTVTEHTYTGDRAIFGFGTEAEAKKYAERMETARQLMNKNDGSLSRYLEENLPYNEAKFRALFEPVKDESGKIVKEAYLHPEDPITHTATGERVIDKNPMLGQGYQNFKDDIRSPYNLMNEIDKKFAGERDGPLMTVREGSEGNPLYRLEHAATIDPLTTMNRAMANVMRNRYMTDYKIQAVESWLSEFGDTLKTFRENPDRVWANPSWYLHNADFVTDSKDIPKLRAADNARRAIINLLGTETPFGKEMRYVQSKILDSFYNTMGQKGADFVQAHLLPLERDPFTKVRAAAFHMTLGLFNPVQVFLQAQTLTHVLALAPKQALPGMASSVLMRKLGLMGADEKTIEHVAGIADRMGFKKEWFKESWENLQRSGLWNVEGEHAWKDDMFDPKLFQGKAATFLDKGTVFFKETERQTRLASWNTAFLEWRQANPLAPIDARARSEILSRANLMSVNMTRASSANWQQGLWSIPTQFLGYQVRLAEQLLGKRLTGAEKARAFGVYSAMYGVPTAGAAFTALPLYEDLRQAAMERGYISDQGLDPSEHPMMKMFMEGIPATVAHLATGYDTNFAERAGPGGIKIFQEIANGDKTLVDLAFGPSASIVGGAMKATNPLLHLLSPFSTDPNQEYSATVDDLVYAAQSISSVSAATKTLWALNTGTWITKNGVRLDDIKPWQAVFSGITGLQPHAVSDAYLKIASLKETKKAQDDAQKEIGLAYRRALAAFSEGDSDQGANYMRRVNALMVMGGFREDQKAQVLQRSLQGANDLVTKINSDFWQKAPASQAEARFKQYGQQ